MSLSNRKKRIANPQVTGSGLQIRNSEMQKSIKHRPHSVFQTCKCLLNYKSRIMPKYVIEREVPGAGNLSAEQLKGISQTSCGVLSNMGPQIQWVHSYVTGDKIYCVYNAPNEEMVREHAKQGGFPANSVSEVKAIIDPVTAE